jgi:hypothetical protein
VQDVPATAAGTTRVELRGGASVRFAHLKLSRAWADISIGVPGKASCPHHVGVAGLRVSVGSGGV